MLAGNGGGIFHILFFFFVIFTKMAREAASTNLGTANKKQMAATAALSTNKNGGINQRWR